MAFVARESAMGAGDACGAFNCEPGSGNLKFSFVHRIVV